ncbi:MAG TPA: serine/threonine protein kinase [Nannocystis exedens]|nr:serine/threonine protein kinase [Nannocystis exedens]
MLNPDYGRDGEIAHRFLQEARTASKLRHEHIIDITDFGQTENTAYFVMELLEGEDLSVTLLDNGPLHYARVISFAKQICTALIAAHRIGIIHRDIKPANCFRVTRGNNSDFIKVLDFGIAKVVSDRDDQKTTGTPLGTPGYMALELLQGESYDHRVDIYALGVLMYKLLTNKMPFPALNAYATVAKQLDGKAIPLRQAAPDLGIPEHLEALIHRALARHPDDRFQSAEALLDALVGAEESLPQGTRLPRDPRDWGGAEAASSSSNTAAQLSSNSLLGTSQLPSNSHSQAPVTESRQRSTALAAGLIALFIALLITLLIIFWPKPRTGSVRDAFASGRSIEQKVRTFDFGQRSPPPAPRDPISRPSESLTAQSPQTDKTDKTEPAAEPQKAVANNTQRPRKIAKSTVDREIRRLKPAMKNCRKRYSAGITNEHTLKVRILIDASTGAVKKVKDLNGGGMSQMGSCVIEALERMSFPPAKNDTALTKTITF